MTRREVLPLHEIAKLELKFRLLFFLRDLGIKNATSPSREVWEKYMHLISELTSGESS